MYPESGRERRRSTSGHRRDSQANHQRGSSRRLRSLSPERRESTSALDDPKSKSHEDDNTYNPYNTVHNLGIIITQLSLEPTKLFTSMTQNIQYFVKNRKIFYFRKIQKNFFHFFNFFVGSNYHIRLDQIMFIN